MCDIGAISMPTVSAKIIKKKKVPWLQRYQVNIQRNNKPQPFVNPFFQGTAGGIQNFSLNFKVAIHCHQRRLHRAHRFSSLIHIANKT